MRRTTWVRPCDRVTGSRAFEILAQQLLDASARRRREKAAHVSCTRFRALHVIDSSLRFVFFCVITRSNVVCDDVPSVIQ